MGLLEGMSMEWTLLGAGIGVAACMVGYMCRSVTRQGLVFRCPIWAGIILAEILLVTLGAAYYPVLGDTPLQAVMICLILAYPVGYSMANAGDCVPIDLIDGGNNSDASLVFHYWREGVHYMMPQTFFGCLTTLLGARWPLEMDLSSARRTRTHTTTNRFFSVTLEAFVAKGHVVTPGLQGIFRIWTSRKALEDGTVIEIPRYLYRAKIESHEVYFAESALEDPNTFLLRTDTYHDAIVMAAQEKGKSLRVEVEANNAAYGAGARILKEMFVLDVDGEEIAQELRKKLEEIRKRDEGGEIDADDLSEDDVMDEAVSR